MPKYKLRIIDGSEGVILGGWETITSHAKKYKDFQQRDLVLLCTVANYDFNVPLTFIHAQGLFNSVQSRFLTNMTRRDVTEDNQELFARLADPARKGREMLDAHMRQRELDRMTASTRAETSRTRTTKPAMRPRSMSFEQPRSKRSCNRLREKPKRDVKAYTEPFLSFITDNPTVFHAVHHLSDRLRSKGFTELSERQSWYSALGLGGKYFVTRNGSSLIAFEIGNDYRAGNGAAIVASHVDAVTARLKPIPKVADKAGYVQLGVAPYAGGLNTTWFDRDLGIAGRVLVKSKDTGKIETRLVKLGWPIARIPTLAPHFGTAANVPYPNKETQMVPIIGLETQEGGEVSADPRPRVLGGAGTFTSTQPEKLVKAIAGELGIEDHSTIVNWELELFDSQPAQLGGLDKEFIFAGRIDDKLCAFAAVEGLIESTASSTYSFETSFEPHILDIPQDSDIFHSSLETSPQNNNKRSSILKITALFDDEEIGSLLRQGALSTLLPSTISRITESFFEANPPPPTIPPPPHGSNANLLGQTYANSFLISADVTHAVNPNFLSVYLENHSPRLNTGIAIQADPNGHTTTDAISTAFLQRIAEKCGSELQVFQIRNDSRSGGTVRPMLSSITGIRAVDAGLPQLSMHSIRATTGSRDPGLGVRLFEGFFDWFEEVDAEFR